MLISFFKSGKNKEFHYSPLYYNQQKEELQDRVKRIENELKGGSKGEYQPGIIKGSFRHVRSMRTKAERGSALRIIIIVMILLGLVYFLFNLK
jgi:hypothetical protein